MLMTLFDEGCHDTSASSSSRKDGRRSGCASSFEDASMLNDSDCEVVHAPGEEEMLGARADEAVGPRERGGPVLTTPTWRSPLGLSRTCC